MDFTNINNNMTKMGYEVSVFSTKEEACEYLTEQLSGKTIGFGGSMTLTEMGLYEKLTGNGCDIFWHWQPKEGYTQLEMRVMARDAEIYISSVNGLSENGEIVNIDGTGNRLAECLYGHKKVILIAGKNKIAKDCDEAIFRARNIASPKNAQRLGRKTPCAEKADRCYDCKSPERICNALSVLWKKPMGSEYEIILIDENLGY